MRVYLVDDEPLALQRLERLLRARKGVEIAGASADPEEALEALGRAAVDVVFLDIAMPGMSGFEMLERLDRQPLVVFTTAYDQYALRAFEVNSIDYLLKPVEGEQLDRALKKLERIRGGGAPAPDLRKLAEQVRQALEAGAPRYPTRLASRLGEKIEFVELSQVTHLYARDKLCFAATASKDFVVDLTITELEHKLEPARFLRIHRATIVNVDYIREMHSWFGGRMLIRLKDGKDTELTVARERVAELKGRLGL